MHHCLMPAIVIVFLAAGGASAQQPYAGMQSRPIKALSDQQIADLKAGRGMGLALAAELNGYPGPVHLLDLADQLGLSDQQRVEIRQLFESMKAEALPLGEKLLEQEAGLDRQFTNRSLTTEGLSAATAAIGETQAALRNTHLKYHLFTTALLSTLQIQRYGELRGYASPGQDDQHRMHHPD
jgi:hypothetical protein